MRDSRRNSRNTPRRSSHTTTSSNQPTRRVPQSQSGMQRTGTRSRRAIRERQRKKQRRRLLSRICIAVLVLLAVIFAPTIFFQVSTIDVSGDTRYKSEELIKSTGVKEGDNMFFLDTKQIAEDLKKEYPYLDTVKLHRKMPSTLQIEVTDRTEALSLEQNDKYFVLDLTGKVLEEKKSAAKNTATVTGISTKGLEVGNTIDENKQDKIASVIKLLELADAYDMKAHIKTIDVEKAYDVRITYDKQYTILLGALEESNIEHKIQFLKAILKEPSLPDTGVIDLTDEKEARYRPTEDTTEDVVVDEKALEEAAGDTKTDSTDGTDTSDEKQSTTSDSSDSTTSSDSSEQNAETSSSSTENADSNASDSSGKTSSDKTSSDSGTDTESSSNSSSDAAID